MPDPAATPALLKSLFDAERAVRRAHDTLVATPLEAVLPHLERAVHEALTLDTLDEDESALSLVRLAGGLGELQGPRVVARLVDTLGCDEPEARHAAGEVLSTLAFD